MSFRLRASQHDFHVDVEINSYGSRWMAVARISGDPEVGLAENAGDASAAALSPLGPHAAAAFLADPQLLGVTGAIRQPRRARSPQAPPKP